MNYKKGRETVTAKHKKIILFIVVLVITLLMLICGQHISDKKEKMFSNQQATLTGSETFEINKRIYFFQEEVLSFLSEEMKQNVKDKCTLHIQTMGEKGVSCAVVLSNTLPLSMSTYKFYLQTNESQNNVYQVIVNEKQNMVDIERYESEIENIEVYGGAGYGDSIESIYIYGDKIEQEYFPEEMTLEEETLAKEKRYKDIEGHEGVPGDE